MGRTMTLGEVQLDLTARQVGVLAYLLARAQEDPDFFDALVGNADHQVANQFRMTVGQIKKKVDELNG